METRHSIDELIFEFNFDSMPDARAFEEELTMWLRHTLLPPFESVFDRLSGAGELLRFETVEIDLGDVSAANFKDELRTRLLQKLTAVLEEKIQQIRNDAISGFTHSEAMLARTDGAHAELQQLLDFLAGGQLAWQAGGDPASAHEQLFKRVLHNDGELLFSEIGRSPQRGIMITRLVRQFGREQLMAFLRVGMPSKGKVLTELAETMHHLAGRRRDEQGDISIEAFWETLLASAWNTTASDEDSHAQRTVEAYLHAGGMASLRHIAQLADAGQAAPGLSSRLVEVLRSAVRKIGEGRLERLQTIHAVSKKPPGEQAASAGDGSREIGAHAVTAPEDMRNGSEDDSEFGDLCRALREGKLRVNSLKLNAQQLAQLLGYFIAHDVKAGIANRKAFIDAIESHAAQATNRESYYLRVLQTLLDNQLVDLELIARASGRGGENSLAQQSVTRPGSRAEAEANSGPGTTGALDATTEGAIDSHEQLRFRLAHCLLHGDAAQLESMWPLLYRRNAGLTREALRHYGKFERIRRQFVEQFSAPTLMDFVELIEPAARPVLTYLDEHAPMLAMRDAGVEAWRHDMWNFAFDVLLGDGTATIQLPDFVESIMRHAARRAADSANASPETALRDMVALWADVFDERTPDLMRNALQKIGKQGTLAEIASTQKGDPAGLELLTNLRRHLAASHARQFDGADSASEELGAADSALMPAVVLDLLRARHPEQLMAMFAMVRRGEFSWNDFNLDSRQLRRLLQFRLRQDLPWSDGNAAIDASVRDTVLHRFGQEPSSMEDRKALYVTLEWLDGQATDYPQDLQTAGATFAKPEAVPTLALALLTEAGEVAQKAETGRAPDLAQVWQQIQHGDVKLSELSLLAVELAELIVVAVTSAFDAPIPKQTPTAASIEHYAARAKHPATFYCLVLEALASGSQIDLDFILSQSDGTEGELLPNHAHSTNSAGNDKAASRVITDDPSLAGRLAAEASSGKDAAALAAHSPHLLERIRRNEIKPADLGLPVPALRNLVAIAIAAEAIAEPTLHAAKTSNVAAMVRSGRQPDPESDATGSVQLQSNSVASKRLLRAINEHAARSADPAAFYRRVLASLARGEQVDLEDALVQSGISATAVAVADSSAGDFAALEGQFHATELFQPKESVLCAPVGAARKDESIDILSGAMRHAAAQQADRIRVAFLSLKDKLAGPLDALSGDELIFLIDRYLEVIAGSDTGNRKMFVGAVADHAGNSVDQQRFLRLTLARLLHRETVDLEEIEQQVMHATRETQDVGALGKPGDANARGNGDQRQAGAALVADDDLGAPAPDDDSSLGWSESRQRYEKLDSINDAESRADQAPAWTTDDDALSNTWRRRIQAEIARQSHDDLGRQAAFLHAIENHAQVASNVTQYYRLVLIALEQHETVDLEAIAAASGDGAASTVSGVQGPADALIGSDSPVEQRRDRTRSPDTSQQAGGAEAASKSTVDSRDTPATWMVKLLRVLNEADLAAGRSLLARLSSNNATVLEQQLTDSTFNEKFISLFSSADLASVLRALLRPHGSMVARYADAAGEALHFLAENMSRRRAFVMAWRASFDYFFVQRGVYGKTAFPTLLAARLAREAGMRSTRPLRELIDARAGGSAPVSPPTTIRESVTEKGAGSHRVSVSRRAGAGPTEPHAGSPRHDIEAGAADSEVQSNVDVYVDNAGLVLAWPYLPRLFALLNLMEQNAFVSRQAAERAVHLLQFMVTGQTRTPEYALVLNKQLCGVATGLPIVAGIDITDREKETIEDLIRGMIQNWKAIGNTSLEGFRQSFLQRQGWLSLQEEVWHLRVQTRAFDMLLDQLPWGISMVKHAWMARPIHVKWR